MTTIAVFGGTGYAGRYIVDEAARRGHRVIAISRHPDLESTMDAVEWWAGDVTDDSIIREAIAESDLSISALSPRGGLDGQLRAVDQLIADESADAGKALYVIGGFSSLRREVDSPRVIDEGFERQDEMPAEQLEALLNEARQMNTILLDLLNRDDRLEWTFVSPGMQFGAHVPGELTGNYRIGTDGLVLVDEQGETAIGGADFARAIMDQIESDTPARGHIAIAY